MVSAIVAGGIALAGAGLSAYSASKQAGAAKDAASQQVAAADRAAELQQQQYEQTRADLAPWREQGARALGGLERLSEQPLQGPGLYQAPPAYGGIPAYEGGPAFEGGPPVNPSAYQFTAPTAKDMMQDPGYQFRLSEGRRLLEGGASAAGLLQSGGTLRGITALGQNLASQEYGNVYNRRLGENVQDYTRAGVQNQLGYDRGAAFNQQAYTRGGAFNQQTYARGAAQDLDQYTRGLQQYQTNANTPLLYRQQQGNELARLAGLGQTGTQQTAQLGAGYAGAVGDLYTQGGNAQAGGILGAQQARTAGLQGGLNAANSGLNNYLFMNYLQQRPQYDPLGGGAGYAPY